MKFVRRWSKRLQHYGNRWWYSPFIGFLACIDCFVILVPTDGLLVTAVMMAPRRWLYAALCISLGSSLGALALAAVIQQHGDHIVWQWFPHLHESKVWLWTDKLMDNYGVWAIFIIGLSPLMQHPAIIIGALAGIPIMELFSAMLGGRVIKYVGLSWIASHSPHLINKLWGLESELKDVSYKKK